MEIEVKKWTGSLHKGSPLYQEIIGLVKECASDLSMFIYGSKSLLYTYLTQREIVRAEMLLNWVGTNNLEEKNLFIATCIDTGEFLGFSVTSPLLSRITGQKQDGTSITLVAVRKEVRRSGVFKEIMNHLQERYSCITLTCSPELVGLYKKYDFKVVGYFQTQISLTYGDEPNDCHQVSIDDDVVASHPSVKNAYREICSKYTEKKVKKEIKRWKDDFAKGSRVAKSYFLSMEKAVQGWKVCEPRH